jgi:Ulp1 family protease
MDGRYDYHGVRTWFEKTFGDGMKVSDMSTLVVFQNQNRMHWVCYGIFLKQKFIQGFDSMGGGDVEALKSIYHWLHDSMESEGKTLTSTEWCLYTAPRDQPNQRNGYDCGLFTILFALCSAKNLPLNLVQQSIMNRGRCQLWHHLMRLLQKSSKVPQQSTVDLITPPPA